VAQGLATLDELSGGRAEGIFSIGNLAMLDQYGREWQEDRPLLRLREAHTVIRTLLDTGTLNFEGEHDRYRGVTTAARPVQERLPLMLGGMRGPRSYELAGEIADGVHSALSYTPEALDFVATAFRRGAERAGREPATLDLAMNVLFAASPDGAAAREVARAAVAFYLPSMPGEPLARHGIEARTVEPILVAFGRGDVARALELTTPALAARLSIAGTPEDVAARIAQMASHGFGHVSLTIADPTLVQGWSGDRPTGVPSLVEQLRLVAQQVAPALPS
jgi:5,10-methylenetetrahydromethanopterin reductase